MFTNAGGHWGDGMRVMIFKAARALCLLDGEQTVLRARVALGRCPAGPKQCEGDGKTPEGRYRICLMREAGKYGRSLGLNYPNAQDARLAFEQGRIDAETRRAIETAEVEERRPPWGSPLGGEIYLHEGDTAVDWTAGCIALAQEDMAVLYAHRYRIESIEILP